MRTVQQPGGVMINLDHNQYSNYSLYLNNKLGWLIMGVVHLS